MNKSNKKYEIDTIKSKSLEDNSLDSPIERELYVFFLPDYFEKLEKNYSGIYCLYGHTVNSKNLNIHFKWTSNPNLPINPFNSYLDG